MTSTPRPPASPLRLMTAVLVAASLAAIVLLAAIIPAEFGRDPSGLGKMTGLARLWSPEQVSINPDAGEVKRTHHYDIPFRSDIIEIKLDPMGVRGARYEIEYKVRMRKDATLVFDWDAIGTEVSEDFYFDFHGHTLTGSPDEKMIVATYRKDSAQRAAGSLIAPFDGIHGWYFQNSAADKVIVRIRVSGFYELIPPGELGNEGGVLANAPSAAGEKP